MTVRIERQGRVWTVIHSRPEARNAMDPESADALLEAFQRFNDDSEAAAAVLWGEGGAFCAGFDLKFASRLSISEIQRLDFPSDNHSISKGPLWCDVRVMEASAYFGVYCRRWGVPLVDGGTVRLPRIVGMGRALELILTGRRLPAEEALRIGACEHVVADGGARQFAEAMACEIARFPQACLRADRRSAYTQQGLPLREAMQREWHNGAPVLAAEAVEGAKRFASGKGRHGDFGNI